MVNVKHIAILECDTPIQSVQARYGTYGDLFRTLLSSGISHLKAESTAFDGYQVEVSKWPVVNSGTYPEPGDVDAILLTGSKHDSFSNESWIVSLVDYVRNMIVEHKKPVVGFCFGHQIIARAMGARVGRNSAGWEIAVDRISLSTTGRKIFDKDTLFLHQMHRDVVLDLPPQTENLGTSLVCGIQGLYSPGQFLSMQAHPEFNHFIISSILDVRHQQKIFNDQLYEEAKARAGHSHDGLTVSKVMIKFVLSGGAL